MSDDLSIPSPTYRVPRHSRGMDPATRRLALIAGCLGGTLLLVVGGWSMIGHRSGAVPVVQADSHPIRVKPENPGGMQVAGANEDILSGEADTDSGKLGPPPEVPEPQALRAPPSPEPAPSRPDPAVPSAPSVAPAAVSTLTRVAPEKPASVEETSAAVPDRRVAAAAPVTEPEHTATAAKGALVQLAAVSSESAAKIEWQRLQQRMPDLLDRRQPAISKIDHDGHILWRVRTGGFSDSAQAAVFCERVRAKGAGCSVADF